MTATNSKRRIQAKKQITRSKQTTNRRKKTYRKQETPAPKGGTTLEVAFVSPSETPTPEEITALEKRRCVICGIGAACNCNAEYVPARVYVAKFIENHPEMNDKAVADATRVGEETVRRVRNSVSPSEGTVVAKRGADGKLYPTTKRKRNFVPKDPVPLVTTLLDDLTDTTDQITRAIEKRKITIDAEFQKTVRPVRDKLDEWLAPLA